MCGYDNDHIFLVEITLLNKIIEFIF